MDMETQPPTAWVSGITEMMKQYAPEVTSTDVVTFIGNINNPEDNALGILDNSVPALMTVPEAALVMRLHRSTVSRLCREGHLTTIRFTNSGTGKALLQRVEVDRYLQSRMNTA
jgi:excisionase family DNA binding protein